MSIKLLKELLLRDSKIINIKTVKPKLLNKVCFSIKRKGFCYLCPHYRNSKLCQEVSK